MILEISEDCSKICINTNQTEEELTEEIEKMKKTIKEKINIINNYQVLLSDVSINILNKMIKNRKKVLLIHSKKQ